jgi:phytol kinase
VNRSSLGEIYFPLGVALAFTLAHADRAAYCAAIGVLAFADSTGALVGSRWGRWRYSVPHFRATVWAAKPGTPTTGRNRKREDEKCGPGDTKSIEGSAAVLVTSILCTTISLATLGDESWTSALAGGLVVGSAATTIEAVSGRGIDNLLLPLTVVGLIKLWTNHAADFQGVRVVGGAAAVISFAVFAVAASVSVSRRGPGAAGKTSIS